MRVEQLGLADVKEIVPERHGDERGFFSETYNARTFNQAGIDWSFVQDNHATSAEPGTVRGLHFQIMPRAQGKLIRVVRGSIFDVSVDIRNGSPTFGRHATRVVSSNAWNQILIPIGFAHGYCTLEPHTEVLYKVTDYYSPEHERGLLWNDPDLGIAWPEVAKTPTIANRDRAHPGLRDLPSYFEFVRVPPEQG